MDRPDLVRNGKESRAKQVILLACQTIRAVSMISLLASSALGCTVQSRHTMLVSQHIPKADDCQIEIFKDKNPSRQFERISRLDVHIERTYYVRSHFDDVLRELQKEACASGADGIIDIQERSADFNLAETNSYHVTATGIRFLP